MVLVIHHIQYVPFSFLRKVKHKIKIPPHRKRKGGRSYIIIYSWRSLFGASIVESYIGDRYLIPLIFCSPFRVSHFVTTLADGVSLTYVIGAFLFSIQGERWRRKIPLWVLAMQGKKGNKKAGGVNPRLKIYIKINRPLLPKLPGVFPTAQLFFQVPIAFHEPACSHRIGNQCAWRHRFLA